MSKEGFSSWMADIRSLGFREIPALASRSMEGVEPAADRLTIVLEEVTTPREVRSGTEFVMMVLWWYGLRFVIEADKEVSGL